MDVWSTLADFCNILTAVNQSEVPLYKDPDDDLTLLILEEDEILFLGLSTLLGMSFLYCEQKTNMA